ncbi:hypothetical protein Ssi03_25870 [Sphaerisporangium siamense]|uniref:Head-tail adaptor protein n=1 Tax=Sphaerisporangium siamense TaxID=795645 RepID=A0A7W7D6Y0_9ACTN|nr:hypothetical protein [Sphaerisporangium siamense]MBB4700086.1 hypothetical protein [Sphaerisporangium siamense]GII84597.1 hypothetical protein Ssi03_25870 [Sphaerisporangium siamense]
MGRLPALLLAHEASIEPYHGDSATGPTYGAAFTAACFADDQRKMVRGPDAREVTSQTTLYLPLDTDCPVGSRVTVNGRTSTVLAVARRDGGRLPTPDHLEVSLQ